MSDLAKELKETRMALILAESEIKNRDRMHIEFQKKYLEKYEQVLKEKEEISINQNWISVEKELPNDAIYKHVIAYFVDGSQDYVLVLEWFDKDLENYKGKILFWHPPLKSPIK